MKCEDPKSFFPELFTEGREKKIFRLSAVSRTVSVKLYKVPPEDDDVGLLGVRIMDNLLLQVYHAKLGTQAHIQDFFKKKLF